MTFISIPMIKLRKLRTIYKNSIEFKHIKSFSLTYKWGMFQPILNSTIQKLQPWWTRYYIICNMLNMALPLILLTAAPVNVNSIFTNCLKEGILLCRLFFITIHNFLFFRACPGFIRKVEICIFSNEVNDSINSFKYTQYFL